MMDKSGPESMTDKEFAELKDILRKQHEARAEHGGCDESSSKKVNPRALRPTKNKKKPGR